MFSFDRCSFSYDLLLLCYFIPVKLSLIKKIRLFPSKDRGFSHFKDLHYENMHVSDILSDELVLVFLIILIYLNFSLFSIYIEYDLSVILLSLTGVTELLYISDLIINTLEKGGLNFLVFLLM